MDLGVARIGRQVSVMAEPPNPRVAERLSPEGNVPNEVLKQAETWLRRSGVPHFLNVRDLEDRRWHALVCIAVAALFAGAYVTAVGAPEIGLLDELAITVGIVV